MGAGPGAAAGAAPGEGHAIRVGDSERGGGRGRGVPPAALRGAALLENDRLTLRDVGALLPGEPVPSTRALATQLGVSRGSVTTAYDQLTGEGFFIADRGGTRITPELPALPPRPRGTTPDTPRRSVPAASGVAAAAGPGTAVAADPGENAAGGPGVHAETGPAAEATTAPEARTEAPVPALRYDLRPGTPDVSALTTTAWRAAWRTAAAQPSLGHPPQGSAALRRELAEHLRTGRSVPADPEDLLVTGGARDGLRLLLTVLAQRLGRALTVAVEDPGYPSLHRVPTALGHRVVPVPLDAQGLADLVGQGGFAGARRTVDKQCVCHRTAHTGRR